MTVWSCLLVLGLGVAIGAAGVYLTIQRAAEEAALRRRADRLINPRPTQPPRSHCRRLDQEANDRDLNEYEADYHGGAA